MLKNLTMIVQVPQVGHDRSHPELAFQTRVNKIKGNYGVWVWGMQGGLYTPLGYGYGVWGRSDSTWGLGIGIGDVAPLMCITG
jgi:hypothetical protein